MKNVKTIAFDADDTLWINEIFFREGEAQLCRMLAGYAGPQQVIDHLYKLEMSTIKLYGYGIKSYILSMVETALDISGGKVGADVIREIIEIGKHQMERPVEIYPGVKEVLETLGGKYELVLATKGDLLDQRRKLGKSGLEKYFGHVEIMSDKKTADYQKLMQKLICRPEEFLMIGNSLKSDIIPVLELGGYAIHIPCDTTWAHEEVDEPVVHPNFRSMGKITDIPALLA